MNKIVKKVDVEGWPKAEGRYDLGNPKSCVAVCTMASIDEIKLPMDKIAIIGKTVTENVGIEKIIENTITNPNIRFLILCGKESKGHFVNQAIISLVENGVDDERRIKGAMGPLPHLKNIDIELIERFREQISPINLPGEVDAAKIETKVDECIKNDPGAFDGKKIEVKETDKIKAEFDDEKDIKLDDKGWFVINIDKENKEIIVEHHMGYGAEAKLHAKIVGKTVEEIAGTIVRLGLISDLYHATYLGKELQKAEIALKTGKEYEQDKK